MVSKILIENQQRFLSMFFHTTTVYDLRGCRVPAMFLMIYVRWIGQMVKQWDLGVFQFRQAQASISTVGTAQLFASASRLCPLLHAHAP